LSDVLFIALCTLLSNGEDFEDMVEFGHQRRGWLTDLLGLPNGIPAHDTFNRVLQIIDPDALSACLAQGGEALLALVKGGLVSFDGKKLRGVSPHSKGTSGLFILSAWVSERRLCIGQKKVEEKSNEAKAVPALLSELGNTLEGATVSIDAIGCQRDIAEQILHTGAEYLLSVKDNQKGLLEEVSEAFRFCPPAPQDHSWEYGHGRFEERKCDVLPAREVLSPGLLSKWKGLQSVVRIVSSRELNGIKSTETRFYISSDKGKGPDHYNRFVRGHWGIENHLHWHLDVTFNEDASRARKGNAPQNLNILRKAALFRISQMNDSLSLKKRRFRASLNNDYLIDLLNL